MTAYRSCPQCGQPYTGRIDKLFCSPACRAQHFRDHQALLGSDEDEKEEPDDAVVAADSFISRPTVLPVSARDPATAGERQAVRALIAETVDQQVDQYAARAAQQAWVTLRTRYEHWVQAWLARDGQPLPAREVRWYVREVEELSASYRAHPAITQAGHPATKRLQVLYKVGDALRQLQQELAEPSVFSLLSRTSSTGEVSFSKKRRQQLRDSLLGEA